MRECADEAVLQSYVDDELSSAMASDVAAHVAACHACAAALNEIINENAIFARAFEPEMALDVPTVRLRERLDSAIAGLNSSAKDLETKQGWSLSGWFTSIAGFFKVSPQRALGFASLIVVIAFAAIFAAIQLRHSSSDGKQSEVAINNPPKSSPKLSPSPIVTPSPAPTTTPTPDNNGTKTAQPKGSQQKKQSKPILVPEPDQLPKADLAVSKPLPGEANYLKAIDALKTEIEASGETAMKPSLRAEYERNLAVLDQAINTTQRTARRHPKDQDSAEFLYASYQSKLDLLTAVAEQVRPAIASR
jgi:hypothetical protein